MLAAIGHDQVRFGRSLNGQGAHQMPCRVSATVEDISRRSPQGVRRCDHPSRADRGADAPKSVLSALRARSCVVGLDCPRAALSAAGESSRARLRCDVRSGVDVGAVAAALVTALASVEKFYCGEHEEAAVGVEVAGFCGVEGGSMCCEDLGSARMIRGEPIGVGLLEPAWYHDCYPRRSASQRWSRLASRASAS